MEMENNKLIQFFLILQSSKIPV
uniref:Uncharacterized protein n=1 Tax=Caenorhabditis elegans TaxID=6239 RepID=V9GZR7_CAEEL|nr:unknown protein [Caenorhabditis elegans]